MKRMLVLFCIACLALSVCGCGGRDLRASVLLGERMAELGGLPAGRIYRSEVAEGETGYASPALLVRLFGEHEVSECFPLLEEYAIYLSDFPEPCEIVMLVCYAQSDADRIAEMLLLRKETLRIALSGTPFRAAADAACIRIDGRLVVMELLPIRSD